MRYYIMEEVSKEKLTDRLEIINIDMEKLNEICYNEGVEGQSLFTKLLGIIGARDKIHFDIFKNEKGIVKEIMEKAKEYLNEDLVEVLDYEKMRDNREKAAKEEGFNDGFNDGFNESKKNIAKNMISKKIDIKLISEVTGLTIGEINKLN